MLNSRSFVACAFEQRAGQQRTKKEVMVFERVSMQRTSIIKLARIALMALAAFTLAGAAQALEWNLREPATKIGADIHTIHEYVMVLIVVIFVGVFGVMFYSVFAHRKSKGAKAANFHENTTVEIIWTVIPLLLLIVIVWPATKLVIAQKDTTNSELTIKVTGHQWKWGYDYVKGEGEGISFVSQLKTPHAQIEGTESKGENYLLEVDNEMVVPIGKKVRILTTAADVIHSWWIPAFGAKQDAMPGFIRDTHFTANKLGVYRGQCVELCGKNHGFMPIVVRVVSAEDYTKWVASQKNPGAVSDAAAPAAEASTVFAAAPAAAAASAAKTYTPAELKTMGEKIYTANCIGCHQATGKGMPPAFPALSGSKVVNGDKNVQIALVLNGKQGTAMAAFGKQLNDTELASVLTYTRNSWGNNAGVVQPADVAALRK